MDTTQVKSYLTEQVKKLSLFEIIIIILGLILAWNYFTGKAATQNNASQLVNALQDTVTTHKDKFGDTVSQISPIRTEKPQVFLTIKSNDAEIQKLQAEVQKYKNQINDNGSITVFNSSTHVDTTLSITQQPDGSLTGTAGDKWYSINTKMSPTGGKAILDVKNEYTVAVVEEGGKGVVKIINKNPYSREGEIRTFATLPKERKRWGVGPYIGYDSQKNISAGLALQWSLLQF